MSPWLRQVTGRRKAAGRKDRAFGECFEDRLVPAEGCQGGQQVVLDSRTHKQVAGANVANAPFCKRFQQVLQVRARIGEAGDERLERYLDADATCTQLSDLPQTQPRRRRQRLEQPLQSAVQRR